MLVPVDVTELSIFTQRRQGAGAAERHMALRCPAVAAWQQLTSRVQSQNLDLGIDCDSRIALVGPNGAGAALTPTAINLGVVMLCCWRCSWEAPSQFMAVHGQNVGSPAASPASDLRTTLPSAVVPQASQRC